jgi:tRNA dimethylallyltransferase
MNKLIVIAGPTASGKTAIAIELAKKLKTEIISADSRQFYKELSIGTAKPNAKEMQGVKHHFIDSHTIKEPLSVVHFENEALELLEILFQKHKTVICVGGSGMFLKAITEGTHQFPHDSEVQEQLQKEMNNKGLTFLQEKLKFLDAETYASIDIENPARVIRALEICMLSNKKLSQLKKEKKKKRKFESTYYILDHPRDILYERINQRVDNMVENGLLEEVQKLQPFKQLQSLNTVGYKELFRYLDDKISFEEAIRLIKRNTRRYAKRQLTWFRGVENAKWIHPPFAVEKFLPDNT